MRLPEDFDAVRPVRCPLCGRANVHIVQGTAPLTPAMQALYPNIRQSLGLVLDAHSIPTAIFPFGDGDTGYFVFVRCPASSQPITES